MKEIREYKQQCASGNMNACYALGWAYWYGDAVRADLSLAGDFFGLVCESGDFHACGMAAEAYMYQKPFGFSMQKKSLTYARNACKHHDGIGCFVLASLYEKGMGIEQNKHIMSQYFKKSIPLLQQTCEQDIHMNTSNYGVLRDAGHACNLLSLLQFDGKSVSKNEISAIAYLKRSCTLLDPDACGALGVYYEDGIYVKKDIRKALDCFARSCAYSSGKVECKTLGEWYRNGKENVIPRDIQQSLYYYQRACVSGDEKICTLFEKMKRKYSRPPLSKREILHIIKNGSKGRTDMGSMPPSMAIGEDAEKVSAYIVNGMKGTQPAAFSVCAACHGNDGEGSRVAPSLRRE
jgi:TPR repeat protein